MVDDIKLNEDVGAAVNSEPGPGAARIIDSIGKLQALKLDQNPAIISHPPRSVSGMVVPQKMGLDRQQVNDLKLQIELGARVARICQRLR